MRNADTEDLVPHLTVPKLWISQSEALFTVMIFYDIKSLTWYPTISWTVCETRIFLQTLEAKLQQKYNET